MAIAERRMRLGNYEPLLDLASGGMGTVHVARHVGAAGFERLVVLKRVHRHLVKDREFRDMFVDEARVASLLRHPNVVPVIDVVEESGELFLVMDYVESLSMSALCRAARDAGEPLPVPVCVRIVSDVLSGLHAAHEAVDMQGRSLELVHRDLSPQNVIVGVDGTSRLIDFGIAKAARRLTVTSGGVLKGKFGYMAPEQLKQLPVDRRADVFAAGVTLFETLTGRKPFPDDDDDALLALLLGDIPDPSSIAPDVPPKLDAVVQYALARDRDERFQTAAAFLQALETAVAPAPPREVARWVERLGADILPRRRNALRQILEMRSAPEAAEPHTSAAMSRTTQTEDDPRPEEGGTVITPRLPIVSWPIAIVAAVVLVASGALLAARGAASTGAESTTMPASVPVPSPPIPAATAAAAPQPTAAAAELDGGAPATSSDAASALGPASQRPNAPRTTSSSKATTTARPSGELRANPYGP